MKNYQITVNGNLYNVSVEEVSEAGNAMPASITSRPVVNTAPVKAVAPAAQAAPATGNAGATKVCAPMPGKILSVKTNVGASLKKGDVIMVLEAMKMENEIVAPNDGVVASINVNEGSSVETGNILATLN